MSLSVPLFTALFFIRIKSPSLSLTAHSIYCFLLNFQTHYVHFLSFLHLVSGSVYCSVREPPVVICLLNAEVKASCNLQSMNSIIQHVFKMPDKYNTTRNVRMT